MKKIILSTTFLLAFFYQQALAQGAEMADTMRSNGKIYVLLAIILIVFSGLIAYLIMIERRVAKIERKAGTRK